MVNEVISWLKKSKKQSLYLQSTFQKAFENTWTPLWKFQINYTLITFSTSLMINVNINLVAKRIHDQ